MCVLLLLYYSYSYWMLLELFRRWQWKYSPFIDKAINSIPIEPKSMKLFLPQLLHLAKVFNWESNSVGCWTLTYLYTWLEWKKIINFINFDVIPTFFADFRFINSVLPAPHQHRAAIHHFHTQSNILNMVLS